MRPEMCSCLRHFPAWVSISRLYGKIRIGFSSISLTLSVGQVLVESFGMRVVKIATPWKAGYRHPVSKP